MFLAKHISPLLFVYLIDFAYESFVLSFYKLHSFVYFFIFVSLDSTCRSYFHLFHSILHTSCFHLLLFHSFILLFSSRFSFYHHRHLQWMNECFNAHFANNFVSSSFRTLTPTSLSFFSLKNESSFFASPALQQLLAMSFLMAFLHF